MILGAYFPLVAALTFATHKSQLPLSRAPLHRLLPEIDRLHCRKVVRLALGVMQRESGITVKHWLGKGCRMVIAVGRTLRVEIETMLGLVFFACVTGF